MRSRPVKARATRIALITASVPEDTKRTCSAAGYAADTRSASATSASQGAPKVVPRSSAVPMASTTAGCAWPAISGPHEHTRSRNVRPSASVTRAPEPRAMKSGVPPTARKARTGELTPPGIARQARS